MSEIPLKVLLVDPDQGSSIRLTHILRAHNNIIYVENVSKLDHAIKMIAKQDINAVYIDPVTLGIDQTSRFIDTVRISKPEIVYVLYMRMSDVGTLDQNMIFGSFRFKLYFKLDKNSSKLTFENEVARTITECQSDLSWALNKEKISVLQEELRFLQRNAEEEPVNVTAQMLRNIQDQLTAYREELNTKELRHYAASFLGNKADSVMRNRCFVVMPYTQEWSKAVETILHETCEEIGLEFEIAKAMEGRFVPHDIWNGITSASVIIADLTGSNANVAYEVGLADAIGKEIILLSQDSKVPFDFSGQRLIIYNNSIEGSLNLKNQLKNRLMNVKRMIEKTIGI